MTIGQHHAGAGRFPRSNETATIEPAATTCPDSRAGETILGYVRELWRYPVKSMAGEQLADADVSWNGIDGDRRWAFVRPDREMSGFPWLTLRTAPGMCRYEPWFLDRSRPNTSKTVVRSPAGTVYDVADPMLAAELGNGVRVIRQDRGSFDAMPLSVITTASLDKIAAVSSLGITSQRFRPNVVVGGTVAQEFTEDGWVGRVIRLGSVRMRVDRRDKRCAVVNIDPTTARRTPAVLRAIAQTNDLHLGVYGTVQRPGSVSVGDPVVLEALPSA